MERVFLSVKGSYVRLLDGAYTIASVFGTVEGTAEADTLVTVSSKSFSWLEDLFSVETWALFSSNALSVVAVLSVWAVAAVDAVLVAAASRFWVVTRWSAGGSTWVIFLTFWAGNWASALHSPFNVNAMSATFSEVGSHRVAWCVGSSFL